MARPIIGATLANPSTYSALAMPAVTNEPDLFCTSSRMAKPAMPMGRRPGMDASMVACIAGTRNSARYLFSDIMF